MSAPQLIHFIYNIITEIQYVEYEEGFLTGNHYVRVPSLGVLYKCNDYKEAQYYVELINNLII